MMFFFSGDVHYACGIDKHKKVVVERNSTLESGLGEDTIFSGFFCLNEKKEKQSAFFCFAGGCGGGGEGKQTE